MPVCVKDLLASANAVVPRVTPEAAKKAVGDGRTLIVDVRDSHEVAISGKIKGAVNIPRGMIEFRADPALPYRDPAFQLDRPIILYCASGGRAALAGKVLKDMGYTDVGNLGGFQDAKKAGVETEPA